VPDSLLIGQSNSVSSLSNEVEGNFLVLDIIGLHKGGPQQLQHLLIFKVVANILQDITISDDSES